MEHLLVCQLLGESWTVFQGYSHGTSVGLSAPGGVMDCVPRL